jgi:hypothetical protein
LYKKSTAMLKAVTAGGATVKRSRMMSGPTLTIVELLRDAADALEEAYRDREDIHVRPASLALIAALRERVEHITAGKIVTEEPESVVATVTQDEP